MERESQKSFDHGHHASNWCIKEISWMVGGGVEREELNSHVIFILKSLQYDLEDLRRSGELWKTKASSLFFYHPCIFQ